MNYRDAMQDLRERKAKYSSLFREEDHPRDDDGTFVEKEGAPPAKQPKKPSKKPAANQDQLFATSDQPGLFGKQAKRVGDLETKQPEPKKEDSFRFDPGPIRHKKVAEHVQRAIDKLKEADISLPSLIQIAKIDSGAIAWFDDNDTGIGSRVTVNPNAKFWKDAESNSKKYHDNGYFSTGTTSHPVLHEVGHSLHKKDMTGDRESYLRNFRFGRDQEETVKKEVSKYATTNGLEFVAEVFAGLVHGKKYSEPIHRWYKMLGGPEVEKTESPLDASIVKPLAPLPGQKSLVTDEDVAGFKAALASSNEFQIAGLTLEQAGDLAAQHGHDKSEAMEKIKKRPAAWIQAVESWKDQKREESSQKRRDTRKANWKPDEAQQEVLKVIGQHRIFHKSQDMLMYSQHKKATEQLIKKGIIDRTESSREVTYRVLDNGHQEQKESFASRLLKIHYSLSGLTFDKETIARSIAAKEARRRKSPEEQEKTPHFKSADEGEGHWVTLENGTHVKLDGNGKITAGPKKLEGENVKHLPKSKPLPGWHDFKNKEQAKRLAPQAKDEKPEPITYHNPDDKESDDRHFAKETAKAKQEVDEARKALKESEERHEKHKATVADLQSKHAAFEKHIAQLTAELDQHRAERAKLQEEAKKQRTKQVKSGEHNIYKIADAEGIKPADLRDAVDSEIDKDMDHWANLKQAVGEHGRLAPGERKKLAEGDSETLPKKRLDELRESVESGELSHLGISYEEVYDAITHGMPPKPSASDAEYVQRVADQLKREDREPVAAGKSSEWDAVPFSSPDRKARYQHDPMIQILRRALES